MNTKNYVIIFSALIVFGCSANNALLGSSKSSQTVLGNVNRIDSEKLAQEGIVYLQEGDLEKAQKLFNAAIKFDPEKSEYHLLLGMSYHLQFSTMHSVEDREKAEIGYTLASKYSPKSTLPWIQLGRLHAESGDYRQAVKDFSTAVELNPKNSDALIGLSVNSYLTGDIKTALWSSSELEKINWDPKNLYHLRAIQFESITDHVKADEYIKRLSSIPGISQEEIAATKKQTDRIKAVYSNSQWLNSPNDSSPKLIKASLDASSQNDQQSAFSSKGQNTSDLNLSSPKKNIQQNASSGKDKNMSPASTIGVVGSKPKAWYECNDAGTTPTANNASNGPNIIDNNAAGIGGQLGSGGVNGFGGAGGGMGGFGYMGSGFGSQSTEETSQLNPIPQPCVGKEAPKMAVIDAVLLRTEDQVTSSYGLNLLNGLNFFFGKTNSTTVNNGSATVSSINVSGFGATASTTAGAAALAYSLNIANATNTRNEVVARPSLVAIDRMPSTFFSGNTLSIAVGGAAGGISTLVDKQVGVSFSITPTIVDDERIMLSVKAVRSFIEPPAPGTTGVALSASRNAVTAAVTVKYGETIILSGLNEREYIRGDSGVPVLKDIPGIQYMFSNFVSSDFFRTVVIMITPRKPITNSEDAKNAMKEREIAAISGKPVNKKYSFYWRVEDYEKILSKSAPNLDTVIDTLETNNLYKAFRSKDLVDTNWATKSRFDQMLHNFDELLWH
jgi:tetratricopeptide (TPR) repeat protein